MGNTQARLEHPEPFEMKSTTNLPPEVMQVWNEVAKHVKNGTQAPLESSKSALEYVKEYLGSHEQAQHFVEHSMDGLVEKMLCQESSEEEIDGSQCIEECLKLSTVIIVKNMDLQLKANESLEATSTILTTLFCENSKYYQENEGKMILYRLIDLFHIDGGFSRLAEYISSQQFATSSRPIEFLEFAVCDVAYQLAVVKDAHKAPVQLSDRYAMDFIDILRKLLLPLSDIEDILDPSTSSSSVAESSSPNPIAFSANRDERMKDAICVANAVIGFVGQISLELLRAESLKIFKTLLIDVESILRQSNQEEDIQVCETVVRGIVLQMLTSNRVELKDFGWERINHLVYVAKRCRSPPKTVIVSNAARGFVNGTFSLLEQVSEMRTTVFEKRATGVERSVYLYSVIRKRCNDYLWVIVSSRHESVDKHYVAKSSSYTQPPSDGWRHVGPDDKRSLPTLRCIGFATSGGDETNTLEHQLVKWAHDSRLISLLCDESRTSNFREWALCMSSLIKLMALLNKRCDKENLWTEYQLAPSHLLSAWNRLVKSDDEQESSNVSSFLGLVFPYLPDDVALSLLRAMRECMVANYDKVVSVLVDIVITSDQDGSRLAALSDVVRAETKKLMWNIRTIRIATIWSENWMRWELLDPRKQDPGRFNDFFDAESTKNKEVPRKPKVSILDSETRLIEVSLPIESHSGEYYVGIFLHASCDSYENGEKVLLAIIAHSDIVQCLEENEDKVNVQLCLPDDGLWSIEWCGVLLRDEVVSTPRSNLTTVDLTTRDKEQMKRRREEVDATDELAKQHAGDIQSTIRKLRGSSSSKLTIESRFSLLNTAVAGGHSALNKLRRLVATYDCDEASVTGIASLENALAEAQLPLAELEASLKTHNKKERIKGFKTHVTALLENGDVSSWLESVQQNDLDSLGGDPNRLYQLLVEAKGFQLNTAAIEAASTRANLFSKKQIKTLTALWKEVRRTSLSRKVNEEPTESFTMAPAAMQHHNVKQVPNNTAPSVSVTQHSCFKESLGKETFHFSTESSLLVFLKENADCIKGSPDAFHRWLIDSEDIASLNDLADAVADDQYLQNVLQQGGVKGFKRSAFKNAVLIATGQENYNNDCEQNKENQQPPSELLCPLSRLLMTNEPVIAADGYTYELAAIAEWFEKQNQQVETAKALIASGNKSNELQSIVDRGIVSPVTQAKMENLSLNLNKTVQTMTRDVAETKKRVQFDGVS